MSKRVIALGFFDGVHIGHSALLERSITVSADSGLSPSVLTFDASPKSIVSGKEVPLINSLYDRKDLINRIFMIGDIIVQHFNKTLSGMLWSDFAQQLIDEFGARYVVTGHDYRFGHRGEGNASKLRDFMAARGLNCDIIAPVMYKGKVSSSTYIRKLLADGSVRLANEYLGHLHTLTGTVYVGERLGTELSFPTINMRFEPGVLVPAYGVYSTLVYLGDNITRFGVTNIGTRPTVADTGTVSVETHILDYSGDLYGKTVRIEFCERLRAELKFAGINELKKQITRDAEAARAFFNIMKQTNTAL